MAKTTKIYIDRTGMPEAYLPAVRNADENDLKILAALLLSCDGEGCADVAGLDELLGIEKADITASVKYWKGAGVLSSKRSAVRAETGESEKKAIRQMIGVEEYSTDELTVAIKKVGTAFVDEAQKAMGRIFNKNEVGKLVGFVDQLGFEEEAVLAIISYCVRLDKKSLSYAEKIAVSFHDEDIFTAEAVHAQIDYLERRNTAIEKIRSLYGFGGRALTTSEKKMFVSWTEDFGFDFEIINKAYEITVDTIHEPAPKYTNGILKKWYENGLKTLSEIDEYIESEKQKMADKQYQTVPPKKKQKPHSPRAQEMEDWFEERLRQSFGDDA